jgi:hypothetical protein
MVFRSPKYYAELRKFRKEQELRKLRNNSDQAISDEASTEATSVRPGPGLKLQAASDKPQASSESSNKPQASSPKQKGSSFKPQASSAKIPEPGNN